MTLVSGIMPTRGRQELAGRALACFLSQTYAAKELVVLDDADDPSFPCGIKEPGVHYHALENRLSIPAKRNLCCQLANGELIMHFDSDDWSDPGRMADQAQRMRQFNAGMTGYHSMLFWDRDNQQAYFYKGHANYAIGTSFCFRKTFWKRSQFPTSFPLGSDNQVVYRARDEMNLITWPANELMVALIHNGNANRKDIRGSSFVKVPNTSLPEGFQAWTTH